MDSMQKSINSAELDVRLLKLMARSEELESLTRYKGNSQSYYDSTIAEVKTDRNIVAFVGPTKSGKSTLINCLMDVPLLCKKNEYTDETYIAKVDETKGPKIGEDAESETMFPANYGHVPGTDLEMWDFPGFGDNKGVDQEILNAICYRIVLKQQSSIRFVLVLSHKVIGADNPLPFYEILYQLKRICPTITDSLCIVCTKREKGSISKALKQLLENKFENVDDTKKMLINGSKQLLKNLLGKQLCIDFRAPIMEEDEEVKVFLTPNKEHILELIKSLEGAALKDMPLTISYEAKFQIATFYSTYYQILKQKVDAMASSIGEYVSNIIENCSKGDPVENLPVYRCQRNVLIEYTIRGQNFENLSDAMKKGGSIVDDTIAGDLKKFRFIEDLQNAYQTGVEARLCRGEHELFKHIMLAITWGITRYSQIISSSSALEKKAKLKEKEEAEKWKAAVVNLKEEIKKGEATHQKMIADMFNQLKEEAKSCVIL